MTSPLPPDQGSLATHVFNGVGIIRFGNAKGNSLPGVLLRRLAQTVDDMGEDAGVRVIVIRSEGTGPFCAGASFDELRSITNAAAGKEFFMGFARLILAMRRAPKFVLARVHGKAVGGGVGIVAGSDYAVAHCSASVKLSELALGIGPFVVGPVIERKIGAGGLQTLAVDATGWRDALWAERRGLYSAVVDTPMELDASVDLLAARLSASSPEAMARLKAAFWQGTEHWDDLLERRAEMSGTLVLSDFTRNAIATVGGR